MTRDDYEDLVLAAYQGEAYGEALFAALAADAGDAEIAYKWRVLGRLESETKQRLVPLVRRIAGEDALTPTRVDEARAEAAARRGLTWAENLAIHDARKPGSAPKFIAMLELAPETDRAAIQHLLDHSRGFFEAVRREIAAEPESLAPVLDLLDHPPSA